MDRKSISELYNSYLDKFTLNADGVPTFSKDDISVIQNAVEQIFSDINKNQSLEIGNNRFLARGLKAYSDFTEDGAQVLTTNVIYPITQDKKIIDLESLFDLNSSFDGSIESIYKRYDDVFRNNFNEAFIGNPLTKEDNAQVLENRKILTQMAQEYDDFDPFESDKDVRDLFRTQQGTTQPTGPQRGDQFYDPKRKRQYVYEGPDETFEGMHSFISDQGRTFVGNLDDLEKFTDESRFLNIDDLSEYRSAIDDLDTFLGDIRHGSKSMEDGFWNKAQKAVRRVNKAEGKVKKKIKYHRMENDAYKKKKVLQGYINDWKQKHTQQNTSQPETTQRTRRRGNVEHRQHTVPNRTVSQPESPSKKRRKGVHKDQSETIFVRDSFWANKQDPDLEDMDGGPDWDGGANDFDQGAYYEEDTPEADVSPEDDWTPEYDDIPPGFEDLGDEVIANLTDEQIFKQAQNEEQLKFFEKARNEARRRLGLEEISFNMDTGNNTINNNFNGVNQERQQQGRNNQQQQRGNQEHKIDTDKPWTWTDDDIRTMADGDPDAAMDLINQREQARQQQQQGQNQQRQTQEQTKNTAEETTGDTSGSSNKETPKGNIDEETLKKRKIERQQRSDRVRHANRRLKGKTGEQLKNRSKGALRRGRAKGKYTGKKFRVKGGNLKQAVANTIINEVAEEAVENILHPNMFNSLDQFADMSDDDIQHFADMIENEDLRKQRTKEWKDKRKQARNERKKQQKIDKQEKIEETINDLHEQYVNGEYKQQIPMHEKAKMNKIEFEVDENGNTIIKKNKLFGGSADGDDIFGWMKKHNIGLGEAINVLSTIGSYKDARKQGKGVVSSIASAAGTFVKGELLGFWGSLGWEVAKGIPKLAIKGAETLYKENRKMNSAANQQVFGGAQFQDTQQLATMRQSGMEMAKMAQYNLQQTLMGAEATHLHR